MIGGFLLGLAAGWGFFAGLNFTVRRLTGARRPVGLALLSFGARIALLGWGVIAAGAHVPVFAVGLLVGRRLTVGRHA